MLEPSKEVKQNDSTLDLELACSMHCGHHAIISPSRQAGLQKMKAFLLP